MGGSIFMDWFGGFPLDTLILVGKSSFEVISLVFYARWLLLIGVLLLMTGCCMDGKDKMKGLSYYRYGTALRWWRFWFWKGLLAGIQRAVCLALVFLGFDLASGSAFAAGFAKEAAKIGLLWLVHVIGLVALFLLLDLCCGKICVPAAVLLLEGITFYVGYRVNAVTNIMYGTWGMYFRSSWFDPRGFPAETILALELLLPAAVYYTGRIYLKKAGCVKL